MADTKISDLTITPYSGLVGTEVFPFAKAGANGGTTAKDLWNSIELDSSYSQPSALANTAALFAKNIGGRAMPAWANNDTMSTTVQPHLGRNKFSFWQPLGNAATVPLTTGFPAATALGTATARNVAVTNTLTRMKRLGYVSVATAGGLAGIYWNAAAGTQITTGDGVGNNGSGFHMIIRFGTSDAAAVSGARAFIGYQTGVAAPTNVEPNTLTNCIGVAQLSTDATQWYLVYGGSAAQIAIALGTAVGAPTLVDTVWDFTVYSSQFSTTTLSYSFTNLKTNVTVSGTVSGTATVAIPTSATYGAPRAWRCNNATALAVGIDIGSISVETDI